MSGKVFISMADKYKADAVGIAKQLTDMGYGVVATRGTASTLMAAGEDHTMARRILQPAHLPAFEDVSWYHAS